MKILYFHPMVRKYRQTIFELLALNCECDFFLTETSFLSDPAWKDSHIRKEAEEILQINPGKYIISKQKLTRFFSNFSWDLIKSLFWRKYKIHIYSGLTSTPFLLTAILSKLFGKKVILFDEMWRYPFELTKYKCILPYVRFLLTYIVDAFVVAGSQAKKMFVNDFAIPQKKIFIAYNTTISNKIESVKEKNEITKKINDVAKSRSIILYLGRIVEYKGLDVLIRAMSEIPDSACLIVVGNGPFQKYCQELTNKLNLNERIFFFGGCQSEDGPYYYLSSDLFVLPSRFLLHEAVNCESWGFTVNEAMSFMVPVVATTAVGSAWDLIKDGETGFLVEENNPKELAEKIGFLIENDSLSKRIGKEGNLWLRQCCNYNQNLVAYKAAIAFVEKK